MVFFSKDCMVREKKNIIDFKPFGLFLVGVVFILYQCFELFLLFILLL
jgi:hypothetical protein